MRTARGRARGNRCGCRGRLFLPRGAFFVELAEVLASVLCGRLTVSFFEVPDEVAFVADTDSRHDLFDAEERSLQEFLGLFHTERAEKFVRGGAGFVFEQLMQTRRGEVHGLRKLAEGERVVWALFHKVNYFFDSVIHLLLRPVTDETLTTHSQTLASTIRPFGRIVWVFARVRSTLEIDLRCKAHTTAFGGGGPASICSVYGALALCAGDGEERQCTEVMHNLF